MCAMFLAYCGVPNLRRFYGVPNYGSMASGPGSVGNKVRCRRQSQLERIPRISSGMSTNAHLMCNLPEPKVTEKGSFSRPEAQSRNSGIPAASRTGCIPGPLGMPQISGYQSGMSLCSVPSRLATPSGEQRERSVAPEGGGGVGSTAQKREKQRFKRSRSCLEAEGGKITARF